MQVHIVSRTYQDPRFEGLTVNRARVYGVTPEQAVALVKQYAGWFEAVKVDWSEPLSQEEYDMVCACNG